MKKLSLNIGLAVMVACVLAGCVSYTRTAPDGTKVAARSFFMRVGSLDSSETDTNGVKRTLAVKELTGDAAMAAAVAEAAAKGVAEGIK